MTVKTEMSIKHIDSINVKTRHGRSNILPKVKLRPLCYMLIVLTILTSISLSNATKAYAMTEQEAYPGAWKSDFNLTITKILASKNIRGCGEYYYKQSKDKRDHQYLVKCTSDGSNFLYYHVWTLIKKVHGPFRTGAIN